ncbi:MAG: hypothetical protein RDU14_17035 [Melioribacteraceae bacterium]|nr:hypothetical protein [Melioribacteraceae bacterium]
MIQPITIREQAIIDGINLLENSSSLVTTAFDREFLNRIKQDREKGWPLTDHEYNRLMEICNRVLKGKTETKAVYGLCR